MDRTHGIVPELYCSEFERSLAFYTDGPGFDVVYRRDDERFALLDLDGSQLMIEQTVDLERMLVAAALRPPYGRGVNLQIPVTDIDGLWARMVGLRCPIFWPLEERWYRVVDRETGVRQFVASDPDGYLLRFSEPIGERRAQPVSNDE